MCQQDSRVYTRGCRRPEEYQQCDPPIKHRLLDSQHLGTEHMVPPNCDAMMGRSPGSHTGTSDAQYPCQCAVIRNVLSCDCPEFFVAVSFSYGTLYMGNTVLFPFLKAKQVILRRRERGGSELPKPTNAVILDTHQWWRNREGRVAN